MAYRTHRYDDSPYLLHDILANIEDEPGKEITRRIIGLFSDAKLPIKVKHHGYDMPCSWYRISCCNRKNIDSVIISTKTGYGKSAIAGLILQVRIKTPQTFKKLDEFSTNVRKQILTGRDCNFCPTGCKGSDCIFEYQGNTFVKCMNIGCNFRLKDIDANDIDSIMAIVKAEVFDHLKSLTRSDSNSKP